MAESKIEKPGIFDRLLLLRPVSALYFAGVGVCISSFSPFDYFPLFTIIFMVSTVLSFAVHLPVLNYVFLAFVMVSFLVFSFSAKGRGFSFMSAASVLSYLFMGRSALRFANFMIFVLLIISNLIGVLASWLM